MTAVKHYRFIDIPLLAPKNKLKRNPHVVDLDTVNTCPSLITHLFTSTKMNTSLERLKALSQQFVGATPGIANDTSARQKVLDKHADDIVITCALRTPLTKARKGGLKDTLADDLLISILKVILSM